MMTSSNQSFDIFLLTAKSRLSVEIIDETFWTLQNKHHLFHSKIYDKQKIYVAAAKWIWQDLLFIFRLFRILIGKSNEIDGIGAARTNEPTALQLSEGIQHRSKSFIGQWGEPCAAKSFFS